MNSIQITDNETAYLIIYCLNCIRRDGNSTHKTDTEPNKFMLHFTLYILILFIYAFYYKFLITPYFMNKQHAFLAKYLYDNFITNTYQFRELSVFAAPNLFSLEVNAHISQINVGYNHFQPMWIGQSPSYKLSNIYTGSFRRQCIILQNTKRRKYSLDVYLALKSDTPILLISQRGNTTIRCHDKQIWQWCSRTKAYSIWSMQLSF